MVIDNLHIICGNCGQDLKESDMASWEYIPKEVDKETGKELTSPMVFIHCNNCTTVHNLTKCIKEQQ